MALLEATLTGSASSWAASLALLSTAPPVEASGDTPASALEALRRACLRLVASEARAQGVAITPAGLVAAENKIRLACALALFRLEHPTPILTVSDPFGFGVDVSTFAGPDGNDLDPQFRPITGQRVVAEAVARRWLTPLGFLAYDPAYGEDLRAYLSARVDGPRLRALEAALTGQALADDRVASAVVRLTTSGVAGGVALRVTATLTTALGPFALVLTVDKLTAALELLPA